MKSSLIEELLEDTIKEMRIFLINKGKIGSKKHIELSNIIKNLSTLALA